MTDRILRMPDTERKVGYKKSAIYAKVAAGEFPAPVRLGPGAIGWRESDLDRWIAERPAAGGREARND